MTKPVTWDQIIDAAADERRQGGRPGQQVRGLRRLDQRPDQGAGGAHHVRHRGGRRRQGRPRLRRRTGCGQGHRQAGQARRPPKPTSRCPTRAPCSVPSPRHRARFMVNWTFIYTQLPDEAIFEDLGWARYPQTVAARSPSPRSAASTSASARSPTTREDALEATVECITSEENQVKYADRDRRTCRRSEAAYDDAELREQFPPDLLHAVPREHRHGRTTAPSPYWSTIVDAVLNEWHPADACRRCTPAESAYFIEDVLNGDALSIRREEQ